MAKNRKRGAVRTRAFSDGFLRAFDLAPVRDTKGEHFVVKGTRAGQPKRSYNTKLEADRAATAMFYQDMTTQLDSYKCSQCGNWHLG